MFAVCIDFAALGITRPQFQKKLLAQKIGSGIHYQDMPGFQLYQQYGNKPGDFPKAEQIGSQTLTLPLFPLMTTDDVDHVCNVVIGLLKGELK
jgi:dTDP-4-amino-4,6-dideoxygalactose transaminase